MLRMYTKYVQRVLKKANMSLERKEKKQKRERERKNDESR